MQNKRNIELLNSPDLFTQYRETKRGREVIASPLEYDELMKFIPRGMLITIKELGEVIARIHKADYVSPAIAESRVIIVANASYEKEQLGGKIITPYWRTLRMNGELNPGYPGGIKKQKAKLETEGHTVLCRNRRYFVHHFERKLLSL